jgi:hypothetical protein
MTPTERNWLIGGGLVAVGVGVAGVWWWQSHRPRTTTGPSTPPATGTTTPSGGMPSSTSAAGSSSATASGTSGTTSSTAGTTSQSCASPYGCNQQTPPTCPSGYTPAWVAGYGWTCQETPQAVAQSQEQAMQQLPQQGGTFSGAAALQSAQLAASILAQKYGQPYNIYAVGGTYYVQPANQPNYLIENPQYGGQVGSANPPPGAGTTAATTTFNMAGSVPSGITTGPSVSNQADPALAQQLAIQQAQQLTQQTGIRYSVYCAGGDCYTVAANPAVGTNGVAAVLNLPASSLQQVY